MDNRLNKEFKEYEIYFKKYKEIGNNNLFP
jgi:hypothetical protein